MKDSLGRVRLKLRPSGSKLRRVGQWLPARRGWLAYIGTTRWWEVLWDPWRGLLYVGSGRPGAHLTDCVFGDHWELIVAIKKRDVSSGAGGARPALPTDSKLLGKVPTLCEFLSATGYEDGSPRTPGYMWLSNRVVAYEVTLFDPDSCSKLPCLGRTLDEALALAETHLRADDAPWQVDPYMVQRAAGKKKK